VLKAPRPIVKAYFQAYPEQLDTIGDHIRKKRLDMKLTRRQVAKQIGVNRHTITGWEKYCRVPLMRHMPKIIDFLGYIPSTITKDMSLGGKIIAYRKIAGITRIQLARQLGVDTRILHEWESNERLPKKQFQEALDLLIHNAYVVGLTIYP
jgi:DNA-binding XRE family transcriptional regulator